MTRVVVAPSVPFAVIDAAAETAGLVGGPTTVFPPLLPGEPELAEWAREDVLVSYAFDPTVALRVLSSPVGADHVVWRRLTAQLPVVDQSTVRTWLEGGDDEVVVRGILAVETLDLLELLPLVVRRCDHARAVVAHTARRVVGRPDRP